VLHFSTSARAVTPEETAGARAAALSGLEAFRNGRYGEAVDYFTRAESIVHAPTHLLYTARAEVQLGHLVRARETYLKLLNEQLDETAPRAFLEAQAAARQELPLLEPRIPAVTVTVVGASRDDVELYRDHVKMPAVLVGIPIPTDPGTHEFWAEAPGLSSARTRVELKEGERVNMELRLTSSTVPESTKEPATFSQGAEVESGSNVAPTRKIMGYSALVLGVGGLGAGTYFALDAASIRRKSNSIYNDCPELPDGTRDCSEKDRNEVRTLDRDAKLPNIVGIVSLAAGTALVTTGVVLLAVKGGKSSSVSSRVWPVVGLGNVGVAGRF
jgi:hypothetical protein